MSRNVNTNLSKVLKTSAGGNLKQLGLHSQQLTDILGLVVCRRVQKIETDTKLTVSLTVIVVLCQPTDAALFMACLQV